MKLKSNKSGFTLLEIIIVIIIVGVLASLALPRFFQTVKLSRATEALNAMGTAKRQIDRCAVLAGGATGNPVYTNCNTWANIGLDDPGLTPGANFTYAWTGGGASVTLTATDTGAAGGAGTVQMVYNTVAGTITRSGTLDYSGIN